MQAKQHCTNQKSTEGKKKKFYQLSFRFTPQRRKVAFFIRLSFEKQPSC